VRKWLFIVLLALIVAAPLAIVATLLYSETGLTLVQSQLVRLERYGVQVEGVSGRLAGPLRIARFELDNPNVHIVSHDIIVYPRIRQLLWQTIGIRSFTAHDTVVEIRRAPPAPPPTKALRFLPSFLRIDIDRGRFAALRYVNIDGTTIEATEVAGGVTLTPRRIRVRDIAVRGTWFSASGAVTLRAQRPLGLELATRGIVVKDDIEYAVDGTLGGTIHELAIKGNLRQPTVATVDVVLTRPHDSWRIAGTVSSPEFSLQPWVAKPPFSLRAAQFGVDIRPQAIRAIGYVIVPELDAEPLAIDAEGSYASRVITIDKADVQLARAPTHVRAAGTVTLNGRNSALDARATWSQLQWPLRGTALVSSTTGSGTLRGTLPYDFTISTDVTGPNLPAAQGTARGTLATDSLSLANFDVRTLDGRIEGSGALQFGQPRAWQLSAHAVDIDPAVIDERFPGRLSIRADASGRGLDKQAQFAAQIAELRGVLREQALRGRGGVERDAKGWRVHDARLNYGNATLALNGELRDIRSGEAVTATWSLDAPSLSALLPDARGRLKFAGSVQGPLAAPRIVVDLTGERIGYQGWRAQQLIINGDVDLGGQIESRLSIEAHQIGAASPLIDTLHASGSGIAEDHRITMEIVGHAATPSEQPTRAQLRIDGHFTDANWTATINSTEIRASGAEESLALAEPGQLLLNRDRLLLEPLCFAMGRGRLCTEAAWQRDGPWSATVSGYELPLAALLPPSGSEARYAGRIEGRVHAFGAPGVLWQGEAGARIIDAAIIYTPQGSEPETLNLGTGGIAATATPERLNFSFGVQAFTDTFLFANATIDRRFTTELLHSPLTGDFRGRAADANILPIVFTDVDNAAGLLTMNGNVSGTLASPAIDGRIELANGEFDSYRVNLALRNLNLVANIAGNSLDFRGSGRAGEGELSMGGKFSWHDGVSRGNFTLRGQNLLVADLPEYRVVASPDLKFEIDGRNIHTTGEVTIPSALVQPADLSGAVQPSADARYVGEHPAEEAGRYLVDSNIRIDMGDDVRIDSFGLQGRIVGGVTTEVRTGQTPIGRGELNVAEGGYEAYGQKLEISRGKLLFEASPLSDPALDIEARRKVETVVVGLNVRGTLQEPRLSFFSEPSMPQTQIVSYLLVGKPVDSIRSSDTVAVTSARDTLAMQGGGLLASQIGRRIGLEEVGVESSTDSAGETNQQLVLGKFLSPRLFVSYGISLTESINTLKLRYTISDRWILKTESGENQSADIEFTIER